MFCWPYHIDSWLNILNLSHSADHGDQASTAATHTEIRREMGRLVTRHEAALQNLFGPDTAHGGPDNGKYFLQSIIDSGSACSVELAAWARCWRVTAGEFTPIKNISVTSQFQ